MKRYTIPWIIAILVGMYVFGLTYHAKNRPPPDPAYDFYDTTVVQVYVYNFQELPDVYGRYNNIIEGERQLIESQPDNAGYYLLSFKVNSPRPAVLYIDDEAIEIFLVPDSTLSISLFLHPSTNRPDSLEFEGYTAGICEYFQEKHRNFSGVQTHLSRNTFNSEHFPTFSRQLDSTVIVAERFIKNYEVLHALPTWFWDFEHSEILYQKAYLKLSNAYNREVEDQYLDQIEINNEGAFFSYYYYLYLKAYIAAYDTQHNRLTENNPKSKEGIARQMAIADTLLQGEMHDVFMTRMIFQQLKQDQLTFVGELLDTYHGHFNRKKYERFLRAQYREKQKLQ